MPKDSEKGFAPIIVILALTLIVGTGAVSSQIKTTTEYPQNIVQSQVLGDDAESNLTEEEKKELMRKEEERLKEKEELRKHEEELKEEKKKKQEELRKEELKKKEEKQKLEQERSKELKKRLEELRAKAEKNRAQKQPHSSDSAELEKEVKKIEKELQVEDGKVQYEQQIGDLKIKYSYENGKLKVKAQAEGGAEIEVEDAEINLIKAQLEQQLKESGIEIGTESSKLTIGKNKIKAKTNFPISVDPETNQLMVTTPAGQKIVTVLPDQAIQNMLSKNVLSEIEYEEKTNTENEQQDSEIELENRNDQVVYKIKGKKEHKLIGFIPVKTETTAYVSAENGEVVAKDESLLSKLIDLISF